MFGTILVFALGCVCAFGMSVLALKFLFGTFFNTSANREIERSR